MAMVASVLDHPLLNSRYFFPRPDAIARPFWVKSSGDVELACYYDRAPRAGRTVLFFHGNGEVAADYTGVFAAQMRKLGVGFCVAEYRGYGESSGEPSLPALLEDAEAMFEALGLPPEQLIVFGRSVGSIPACELVLREPAIAGLVLESGIADVRERVLMRVKPAQINMSESEFDKLMKSDFDHAEKLGAYPGPLLLLHAEHDTLVSAKHALQNAKHAAGVVTKALLPLGDHNNVESSNRIAYWKALGDFVASLPQLPAL